MSAVVGVVASALCLVFIIIFCVSWTYKTKKGCFKHKGPAFERDTNFRIYPNENYIVSIIFAFYETLNDQSRNLGGTFCPNSKTIQDISNYSYKF
jgi:hypothetical protein